jgi:hypothetical protein
MNGSEAFMGLTVKEKQSVIRELYLRYQSSGKKDKSKTLDELCQITALNRKYLLHLLANWGKTTTVFLEGKRISLKATPPAKPRKKRAGKTIYGPEVVTSLKALWEYFGFMCGQLLAPFIRANMAFLEQEEAFHITPPVREKLLAVSSRTRFRGGDHQPETQKRTGKKAPPGCVRHKTGKVAETYHPYPGPLPLE